MRRGGEKEGEATLSPKSAPAESELSPTTEVVQRTRCQRVCRRLRASEIELENLLIPASLRQSNANKILFRLDSSPLLKID